MPFKSEKQRRYLWANEPEIARDWSDKYGGRVKKDTGGITRIPFANGSIYPLNILGSDINDPNAYKQNILNRYQDIAKQNNLTYEDSPIFNRGLEAWDPYSLGSQVLQNWSIPAGNFFGSFADDPSVTYGGAGLMGTKTSAGFKNDMLNKIKSGAATEEEKLQFGQTFGHEMSHLGMTYKPRDELINVPGVGKEGGKRAALLGSVRLPKFLQDKIPGLPGEYEGEEQWNRMHDLIYGGTTDWRTNLADLQATYQNLPPRSPERKEAFNKALEVSDSFTGAKYNPGEAEKFLRDSGLIAADLSYTPYGHEKIGWSGLTSESKKALGFGVNPHEDTMMGQMRTYPNRLSDEAWLADADKRHLTASNPNVMKDFSYSTDNKRPFKYDDTDDDEKALSYAIKRPTQQSFINRLRNRFYKPATAAVNLGGGRTYTPAQLNRMNALGGYYSGPARDARRLGQRRINILNRAQAGKPVGNVNQLLKDYGYKKSPSGGITFTGGHEGSATAGAGYSRSDSGWDRSPFRKGGLATLWQR